MRCTTTRKWTIAIHTVFIIIIIIVIFFTLPASSVKATSTSPCYRITINGAQGVINTGNQGPYSENVDCHWNLSSNVLLELVFVKFETESCCDFVTVHDGDSMSPILIGRFSGSSLPPRVTSSSNRLSVRFKTDGSKEFEGVTAIYQGNFSFSFTNNSSWPSFRYSVLLANGLNYICILQIDNVELYLTNIIHLVAVVCTPILNT